MEGGDREFANSTLPILKAFLEACSHNVSGNKHFFYELAIFWSAKKRHKHFISTLYPLSTVIFATAFVLLRDSRFNFHCYTQRDGGEVMLNVLRCHLTY